MEMAPRFWCHECAQHVQTRTDEATAELCCRRCGGYFVEQVDADDPPEQFAATMPPSTAPIPERLGLGALQFPPPLLERDMFDDFLSQIGADVPPSLQNRGQFRGDATTTRDARTSTTAQAPSSPSRLLADLVQSFSPPNEEDAAAAMAADAPTGRTRRARFINRNGDPVEFYVSEGEGDLGPVWGMLTGLLSAPSMPGFVGNPDDYAFGDYSDLLNQLLVNDSNRHGAPPASQRVVEHLPHHTITRAQVDASAECPVCKDAFAIGDDVHHLPCTHEFHPDCILPWLKQHNSCPVCRFELPTDDEEYERRRRAEAHAPH